MVQPERSHFADSEVSDIPQTKVGPSRAIVRPPAQAGPPALHIDALGPSPAPSIVPTDNIGRPQPERQQLLRIVEIAARCTFRKPVTRDGASASRKAGAAVQHGSYPFRKASESFGNGAGGSVAQIQNGVGSGVVYSSSALRREIERTSGFVFAGSREIGEHTIENPHRLGVGPFGNSVDRPNHSPSAFHRQNVDRPGAAE